MIPTTPLGVLTRSRSRNLSETPSEPVTPTQNPRIGNGVLDPITSPLAGADVSPTRSESVVVLAEHRIAPLCQTGQASRPKAPVENVSPTRSESVLVVAEQPVLPDSSVADDDDSNDDDTTSSLESILCDDEFERQLQHNVNERSTFEHRRIEESRLVPEQEVCHPEPREHVQTGF